MELTSNKHIYVNTYVFCTISEDDLQKIKQCWHLSRLYVKVFILILVHWLVLPIKMFVNALT